MTVAQPADAAGVGFGIVHSPNPAAADASYLGGVSCSSATACAAVGHDEQSGAEHALVENWNGAGWGLPPLHVPSGTTSSELHQVSCVAATACLAAGYYELADGVQRPLAEQWNGSSWTIALPLYDGAANSVLTGVSCVAATDCTAVGFDTTATGGAALVERWNGTAWTIVATPVVSGDRPQLWAVSCVSATACLAVGNYSSPAGVELTLGERWNGVRWLMSKTRNHTGDVANYLYGISCTTTTSCIAVGQHNQTARTARSLVESFDGSRWTAVPAPSPANRTYSGLVGVGCASATSCVAVGSDVTPTSHTKAYAESWDGTAWKLDSVANPRRTTDSYLNGASCPTTGGMCTVAGGYDGVTIPHRTLIEVAPAPGG